MRSVVMVFRAELMKRRASWLALALLVTLMGGTVLAGVSSAQRTSSAFAHFTSKYGFNADVYSIARLPRSYFKPTEVTSLSEGRYYFNGNLTAGGRVIPGADVNVVGLPFGRTPPRFKMLSGHLPTGPREALIGFSMQEQFGLKLGSTVEVPFYSLSQRSAVLNSNSNGLLAPAGKRVDFKVVGVEANEIDFPSGGALYTVITGHAFENGLGRDVASMIDTQVRLRRGERDMPAFQVYVNHHSYHGLTFVQDDDTLTSSVAASIQPQATGWWLFALFAALASLALIGQALFRQSVVEQESYPALSALGMRPRELFQLGMARAGLIGLAGALGAAAAAFAVSPLTPVGEARIAEPNQGFTFSFPLLAFGALSVFGVVFLLAVIPSWRAASIGRGTTDRGQRTSRANSTVTLIAKSGAPPSVLVGVRNALDRGRGRNSVPVATALLGAVMAVAILVATTVFGASLRNLVTTPRLYGQNWQLDLGDLTTSQRNAVVATLDRDPAVKRITWSYAGKLVEVGKVPVESVLEQVVKGPMVFSLAQGRYPLGDSQIALGSSTLAQAGLHLGSKVRVSIVAGKGEKVSQFFDVVGVVALPSEYSNGGMGTGVVAPFGAVKRAVCPPGPQQASCDVALQKRISGWNVAVGVVPGASGRDAVRRLERQYAPYVNELTVPINLVNFGQAVDFPLLLGLTLALFGAATLAHVLIVSVVRRRRQVALLKVLGFVRRQVLFSVCWQAITIAAGGIVVGLPLGVLIGRSVWKIFASHLGAVPVSVAPVGVIVLVCGVIIVGGVTLALIPAALALRVRPSEALREA